MFGRRLGSRPRLFDDHTQHCFGGATGLETWAKRRPHCRMDVLMGLGILRLLEVTHEVIIGTQCS
jgi:hypothetical protein